MLKPETLKVLTGASIIITAFGIMLHSVLGYVFSLARLGLIILVAVVVSAGLAFTYQSLIKRNKTPGDTTPNNTNNSENT